MPPNNFKKVKLLHKNSLYSLIQIILIMIKNIFLISGLFICTVLRSQTPITIISSDMPDENDSVKVSVNNTIGIVDPSLSGPNHNWDFSALTPNTQQFEKFDSPQEFTSPYNLLFSPINTSYGRNNYEFASISLPGGTQITEAYDFFKETTSQYKQIGSGYTVNATPIPFYYTSVDVIYEFPMNYLNADNCDYKYCLNIPGMGYYGEKGHRENLVDGWGTLTTPFGTFQTLRIKSTVAAIDSIYYSSFGFGTNITRPLRYEFKWLATGMKIPVLKIDASDVAGTITVNNVRYIDSNRIDVPQVGIVENIAESPTLFVYPNPCVNEVMLHFNITKTAPVKIIIFDVFGKTVADIVNQIQIKGTYQKLISTKDLHLSPGIYFLNLQTNNYSEVQKIVVTN